MYTDNDLLNFYDNIQKHCENAARYKGQTRTLQGAKTIHTDFNGDRYVDFEIDLGVIAIEILGRIDPYHTNEFRVEVVVGDKGIDTIFTENNSISPDFHTVNIIETLAAAAATAKAQ